MSKIIMTVNKNAQKNKNKILASGVEPMDYYSERTIEIFISLLF